MSAGTEEEDEQLGSCCNFPIPQGPFCKKGMYCATVLFYMIHSFLAKKDNFRKKFFLMGSVEKSKAIL